MNEATASDQLQQPRPERKRGRRVRGGVLGVLVMSVLTTLAANSFEPASASTLNKPADSGQDAKNSPGGDIKSGAKKAESKYGNLSKEEFTSILTLWGSEAESKLLKDGSRSGVNYLDEENQREGATHLINGILPDWQARQELIRQGSKEAVQKLNAALILKDSSDQYFYVLNPDIYGWREGEDHISYHSPEANDPSYPYYAALYKDPAGQDQMINIFDRGVGWPSSADTKLNGLLTTNKAPLAIVEGLPELEGEDINMVGVDGKVYESTTSEYFPSAKAALRAVLNDQPKYIPQNSLWLITDGIQK